ncbi:MAG: adenylate kinase [Actinomycetota bacterium]
MELVILGPQGAGKGTQSVRLIEKYAIPDIATGDIFRAAMKDSDNELGAKVREYVDSGRLVPDDLVIEIVLERLKKDDTGNGFLLDGYPRSRAQAEALDHFLSERGTPLDGAIVIEVPEEVSLRRILGRRVCGQCGWTYSVDMRPKSDWTCDRCGGEVAGRMDDQEEATVRERLKNYTEQTLPLKKYYDERDVLVRIDGTKTPDEVFSDIVTAL